MWLLLCTQLPPVHFPTSFQEPLAEEEEEEGEQPNPPVMVPVADLLNHVANHNANLEYSPVSGAESQSGPFCVPAHACILLSASLSELEVGSPTQVANLTRFVFRLSGARPGGQTSSSLGCSYFQLALGTIVPL